MAIEGIIQDLTKLVSSSDISHRLLEMELIYQVEIRATETARDAGWRALVWWTSHPTLYRTLVSTLSQYLIKGTPWTLSILC